jgi:hypothetical protein
MTGPLKPGVLRRGTSAAQRLLARAGRLAVGAVAVWTLGFPAFRAVSGDAAPVPGNPAAARWSRVFWALPIPPQGTPPPEYAAVAGDIRPQGCALCHFQQYQDWNASRHRLSMGPGVLGQFPGLSPADRTSCLACHAPLSEQWALLDDGRGGWAPNPAFRAELLPQGLTCAACHLRGHRRNGPPLTPAQRARGSAKAATLIHGEPVTSPYFEASEFCAGCHQHDTTAVKINGKPVENTFQEWLDSPAAREGRTCQSCHMPGRRHLWKGIHDPELTRAGVRIAARVVPARPRTGTAVQAGLTLTNTGTGHAFPTYTTPAIYLRAAFLDAQGQVLPGGYFEEAVLQRTLDMSTAPWTELADARLLPGKAATLRFSRVAPRGATTLYLWVWVEPDHFYTGFFRDRLAEGAGHPDARLLEQALRATQESQYLLYSRRVPIAGGG